MSRYAAARPPNLWNDCTQGMSRSAVTRRAVIPPYFLRKSRRLASSRSLAKFLTREAATACALGEQPRWNNPLERDIAPDPNFGWIPGPKAAKFARTSV